MSHTIGVIFGGRSGEHEVSLVSAESVMNALDPDKYNIVPIGITKSGRWITGPDTLESLKKGGFDERIPQCLLSPDPGKQSLLIVHPDGSLREQPLDVVFPVLHGPFGEDGTIQGMFEMAGIPYVGSGVLASAAAMDKIIQKKLFNEAGIPQTEYRAVSGARFRKDPQPTIDKVEFLLEYPVFVKPAAMGSSVGITKAHNRTELVSAIELAAQYDRCILVERAVREPRELEIGVLGNEETVLSTVGEIIPCNEFYDYNAKYVDGKSELVIPADIPAPLKERIEFLALRAYRCLKLEGLARVDFLYSRETGELLVNEANTMPGFTSISMYPKLFEASGIPYPSLLERLIKLAIQRHVQTSGLNRSYDPVRNWYAESQSS